VPVTSKEMALTFDRLDICNKLSTDFNKNKVTTERMMMEDKEEPLAIINSKIINLIP
jgi:hypothetical protein